MRMKSGIMLAAMIMSSLKNRFVLIFLLITRIMMRVAAKLVHHQLNSRVGWFCIADRGPGGELPQSSDMMMYAVFLLDGEAVVAALPPPRRGERVVDQMQLS